MHTLRKNAPLEAKIGFFTGMFLWKQFILFMSNHVEFLRGYQLIYHNDSRMENMVNLSKKSFLVHGSIFCCFLSLICYDFFDGVGVSTLVNSILALNELNLSLLQRYNIKRFEMILSKRTKKVKK